MNKEPEKIEDKRRTLAQNRAMHLYFSMVADALNDAGLDMKVVLKPEVEIPWSAETVKEYLWRSIQKVQLRKESTADLEKKEIDTIYDTLNAFLAKKGIHIPFPSIENVSIGERVAEAHVSSMEK